MGDEAHDCVGRGHEGAGAFGVYIAQLCNGLVGLVPPHSLSESLFEQAHYVIILFDLGEADVWRSSQAICVHQGTGSCGLS